MALNEAPKNAPKRLTALIVASLLACASAFAAVPAQAADGCAGADVQPGDASPQELAHTTLCLLNGERTKRGLVALRTNAVLSEAAAAHSSNMVARDFFAHTAPGDVTFYDRISASGYLRGARSWTIGENLLWGTLGLATPAAAMDGWMNSPGHRENILAPEFREVGIGIFPGRPGTASPTAATYTTDFGAKTPTRAGRAKRRARHTVRRARRASHRPGRRGSR